MRQVHCNGQQLQVFDEGHGPVLLLVHGFPLDHTMWKPQLEELVKDARVIAPDLRGFGGSLINDHTVLMEQYADDLAALLDQLDINQPVIFCGLSMGGYIAWQFWKRYPARLEKLIVCDTRAVNDTPEMARGRQLMAERAMREGTEFIAETMLPKLLAPDTLIKCPELVDDLRKLVVSASPMSVAAAQRGMSQRKDVRGWLPNINVPTLVVCGRYDVVSPSEEMREIAAGLPDAVFVELADAGHMAPLENPVEFNRVLRKFCQWC